MCFLIILLPNSLLLINWFEYCYEKLGNSKNLCFFSILYFFRNTISLTIRKLYHVLFLFQSLYFYNIPESVEESYSILLSITRELEQNTGLMVFFTIHSDRTLLMCICFSRYKSFNLEKNINNAKVNGKTYCKAFIGYDYGTVVVLF